MRRGKDSEEKILEPMFPRLHVNDSDNKGGPRAPPRNKMALYEQLSIPSQRFTPDHSSSQGCGGETLLYVQQQVSSSARVHSAENFVKQGAYVKNVRSLGRSDQRKLVGEEDDFSVPVFVTTPRRVQSLGTNKEKPASSVALSSHRSCDIQEVNPECSKQNGSLPVVVREEVKEVMKRDSFLSSLYVSARKEMDVNKSKSDYYGDNRCDGSLRRESRSRFDGDGEAIGNKVEFQFPRESNPGEANGSPDEVNKGGERISQQQRNEEGSDGSDDSIVDCVSNEKVSPDDVVGVIGQKRFWRARKAINNQQRLFAVQLFELHRLIKVQRLIAASPDLLLGDVTYLEGASAKSSPQKKLLPSEYIVKPVPLFAKHRDDSEKTNNQHKMECSAENVFGRTHVSPVNPPASPAASNTSYKTPTVVNGGGGGGWCFPPPPQPTPGNHQWLIPVMSPSEGLIYKPYPGPGPGPGQGPGHPGPPCGGYYGQYNHFPGAPPYGLPNPAYHPGVGFPSYFPPYGMLNPPWQQPPTEQTVNQFSHPGYIHNPTMNAQQQQSSCNYPTNGAPKAPQPHPQPPIRSQPRTRESEPQLVAKSTTLSTRVIRVVPHNARLASENAARIFQSIQEERKLYEP